MSTDLSLPKLDQSIKKNRWGTGPRKQKLSAHNPLSTGALYMKKSLSLFYRYYSRNNVGSSNCILLNLTILI